MANIVQWQDLFVLVDDGHVSIREYELCEPLVREQASSCANGLACLVIIPDKADPPSSAVRRHLEGMLGRLPIRSLAYLVEGSGFRAATARAALIGLGIFQRKRYPTDVFTAIIPALEWLLSNPREARAAMKVIQESRASATGSAKQPPEELPRRTSR